MKVVKDTKIACGYRLEVSKRQEELLELAYYEKEERKVVDQVPAKSIKNFKDAWVFIEGHIGTSINCDFTEEAVKKIFE